MSELYLTFSLGHKMVALELLQSLNNVFRSTYRSGISIPPNRWARLIWAKHEQSPKEQEPK